VDLPHSGQASSKAVLFHTCPHPLHWARRLVGTPYFEDPHLGHVPGAGPSELHEFPHL